MDNSTNMTNRQSQVDGRSRLRRLGFVAAGIGLGSLIAYLISKTLTEKAPSILREHIVDDRGTGQAKAARILRNLRDRGFESSDEKLALALGRNAAEVEGWYAGSLVIDDDVVMKARGIALNRGIHVE